MKQPYPNIMPRLSPRTARPKPRQDVNTSPSYAVSVPQRKVSEEDIQEYSWEDVRTSDSMESWNFSKLKRPAPSSCLADLVSLEASPSSSTANLYPQDTATEKTVSPSSSWGHFIEVLPEDDNNDCEEVSCGYTPSDRGLLYAPKKRRRTLISSPTKASLSGFVLTVPEVDEAAYRLSNLNF